MTSIQIRQYVAFALIIGGILSLVIIGLLLSDSRESTTGHRRDLSRNFHRFGDDIDPEQVWLTKSGADLQNLREDNESLRSELERLSERLQEFISENKEQDVRPTWSRKKNTDKDNNYIEDAVEEETFDIASPSDTLLPVVAAPAPLPEIVPPSPPATLSVRSPAVPVQTWSSLQQPDALSADSTVNSGVLVLDLMSSEEGNDIPSMKHYLPAGSFVRVILMTGLDAPTGGGVRNNPVPVLLSLADEGTLPNRLRHRVRDCLVTAAGYGDLAAERAYLRLERISCVLKNGDVVDLALQGYVVGEDGKAGLRGRVISKQGALIARSLLAGIAGGLGEGVAQSYATLNTSALGSVQTVEGANLAEFGLARGAGRALEQVSRWYLERADEIYPIIEIDSGRVTEIVLTRGLDLGTDLLNQARIQGEGV